MMIAVREMILDEVELILDYFHGSTPEHLELLGVDPTRLPDRHRWRADFAEDYARGRRERSRLLAVWEVDGVPVGFSTADKIRFGDQAHMHLHVVDPDPRARGIGAACVRQTVDLYLKTLDIERDLCEPNAFKAAPNRTLQAPAFATSRRT